MADNLIGGREHIRERLGRALFLIRGKPAHEWDHGAYMEEVKAQMMDEAEMLLRVLPECQLELRFVPKG